MNGLAARGVARGMDEVDGGSSAGCMSARLLPRLQYCMSGIAIFPLDSSAYSCRAFTANSLTAHSDGVRSVRAVGDRFQMCRRFRLIAPCSLTLICSSLIQRLTLAAAFAAAFFMGDGFGEAGLRRALREAKESEGILLQIAHHFLQRFDVVLWMRCALEITDLLPVRRHIFR